MSATDVKKKVSIPLLNAQTATFECSYGRGCKGDCCTNGRPGLSVKEQTAINSNLDKILPLLKPKCREIIEKKGIATKRTRHGLPLAAVVDSWCIYFNDGCALHKAGAMEGDVMKYKPMQCAIFPLLWDDKGEWYVRQWGYQDETWDDLFCLNPKNTKTPAAESLQNEMNLAASLNVRKAG